MKCPDCEKDSGGILYVDTITCDGCGDESTISYCACSLCDYTWRLKNDEFLDGSKIDEEIINQMLEDFEATLDEELNLENILDDAFDKANPARKRIPIKYSKMSDMLHNCIKCGETAYQVDDYSFKCSACDFEWEVLEGGQ